MILAAAFHETLAEFCNVFFFFFSFFTWNVHKLVKYFILKQLFVNKYNPDYVQKLIYLEYLHLFTPATV